MNSMRRHGNSDGPRALLVSLENSVGALLRGQLADRGYAVEIAAGGAAPAAAGWDLIALPAGHDEVSSLVRAAAARRPLLVATGCDDVEAAERALERGVDEALLVSADADAVRLALSRLERRRRARDETPGGEIFRVVVDSVPASIAQIDEAGRCEFANASLCAWLGRTSEEIVGRALEELYGRDYERLRPWVERALAGEAVSFDTAIDCPGAGLRDVSVCYVPFGDGRGGTMGFFAISNDVTATRRADAVAEQSHRRLVDAIESLSDAFALFDAEDRLVLCNGRYREMYELVGDLIEPGVSFETLVRAGAARGQALDTEGDVDAWVAARLEEHRNPPGAHQARRHDGTWILIDERKTSDGGIVGIRSDVTERVRAEEELRRTATQLRLITDNLPAMITYVDADRRLRYANRIALSWYDQPSERVLGKLITDILGEEFLKFSPRTRAALAGEPMNFTERVTYPDGITRDIDANFVPNVTDDGTVVGFFGLVTDVTERLRAEHAYRRFVIALDNLSEALALFDSDDKLVICNRRYHEVVGLPEGVVVEGTTYREILEAMVARELIPEASAGGGRAWIETRLAARRNLSMEHGNSEVIRGGRAHVLREYRLSDGSGIILLVDIEDQRQRELQLRQSQKMEAIGQLTGGISHDFNNLLAVIQGNLSFMDGELPEESEWRTFTTPALRAARRGASLTKRLLSFARQDDLSAQRVDVGELLRSLGELLERSLGAEVRLSIEAAPDLWYCELDPGELQQAILNLANNARDAMDGPGNLLISATNRFVGGGEGEAPDALGEGDYVVVAVNDDGAGMVAEVVEKIFEPFFTTKTPDKGTGLGLSMVYGFVHQSGGAITVRSEPGDGTGFELYLPRAGETPEAVDHVVCPLPAGERERSTNRTRTILVVEDDEDLRQLVRLVLDDRGYRVLDAGSGPDALSILAGDHDVDLLLTDVILPGGLSGPEIARDVRQLKPDIPVIFMSGYTADTLRRHDTAGGAILIHKPFDPESLARRIDEMLE